MTGDGAGQRRGDGPRRSHRGARAGTAVALLRTLRPRVVRAADDTAALVYIGTAERDGATSRSSARCRRYITEPVTAGAWCCISRRTRPVASAGGYSTVTDLARLRGLSTSNPRARATAAANTCNGTVDSSGWKSVDTAGIRNVVGVGAHRVVALLGEDDGDRAAGLDLADVAQQFGVQHRGVLRRGHHHDDRQALLDQRDRTVLQLTGGEALGVHVRQLLELERALQRHRVADVAAEEQHRRRLRERRPAS